MTFVDLLGLVHDGASLSVLPVPGGFRVTLEQGARLVQVGSPYLDDDAGDARRGL